MHCEPDAKNFPGRNRIVVGLSLGVLAHRSRPAERCAHQCAGWRIDYNREVFALPGRVDQIATSAGTNGLIREGAAKLVTCLEDILDELGGVGSVMQEREADGKTPAPERPTLPLAEAEQRVLSALTEGPIGTEVLCDRTGLEPAVVSSTLTMLELKGYTPPPARRDAPAAVGMMRTSG